MQIDDPAAVRPMRRHDDDRREILAILAESGFVPAQGIEAMIDRLFGWTAAR